MTPRKTAEQFSKKAREPEIYEVQNDYGENLVQTVPGTNNNQTPKTSEQNIRQGTGISTQKGNTSSPEKTGR